MDPTTTPNATSLEDFPVVYRLPRELLDDIPSHINDIETLVSFSLTCHSWHISAQPHLYHSVKTGWCELVGRSHQFHLFQFVKRLWTHDQAGIPLICETFHRFSALNSLQELRIDNLQLYGLMPNIKQYFGHFLPALHSLALRHPNGSCKEILYFIGFFPNLQNFKLQGNFYNRRSSDRTSTPKPPSKPPLSGWLKLKLSCSPQLVEDMITFYGGQLHFRCVELKSLNVCSEQMVRACEKTLETLQLTEKSVRGEYFLGWEDMG